jgi:hypothetical protein
VAFVLFLVHFVNEQETLATPYRCGERDQSAAGIHAQSFGSFVERFAFDCPSIYQHRKIYPKAVAPAAFWNLIAVFVHSFAVSAGQSGLFGFLQEVPNPAHNLPRFRSFVFYSIVTQTPAKEAAAAHERTRVTWLSH